MAVWTRDGWVLPGGQTVASLSDCYFAVGSGWRLTADPDSPRPRHRRHRMEPLPDQTVTDRVVDDAAALPVPVAPVAHEVQTPPQPDATDLAKVTATAGDNPLLAVALAALAVVGGGSAWKLWTKRSEQSHELAMKRLELDAATMNGTAQPPPCQTKQAEVDAKLAALEARIAKTEKASLALPADFDADELTGRLGKVEAAVRRMGVKPPATKGGSK